jgi:hypothetical protein
MQGLQMTADVLSECVPRDICDGTVLGEGQPSQGFMLLLLNSGKQRYGRLKLLSASHWTDLHRYDS